MHIKVQWVLAGPWNSLWGADAADLCTILSGTRAYYSMASESGPALIIRNEAKCSLCCTTAVYGVVFLFAADPLGRW